MPDISLPIIDTIFHPPIGLLRPHLDNNGPITGNGTIVGTNIDILGVPTDISVGLTYGVQWQIAGPIPPKLGYQLGWVSEDSQYDESHYWERLLQLVVQHQFQGGAWVTTQQLEINSFPGIMLWEASLPGRVGFRTMPGLSFDLFWLRVA